MNATHKKLLAELVKLRQSARLWIKIKRMARDTVAELERTRDVAKAVGNSEIEREASERMQATRERLFEYRFELIEVGR